MLFRKRLKLLLSSAGWSQAVLAKRSGVGQAAISNWISRGTTPGWDGVCAVADAFGVSTEFFRSDEVDAPREIVVSVSVGKVGGPHKLLKELTSILDAR